MLQTVDYTLWQLRNVVIAAVGNIVAEYCDNLVISLVTIQHTEATDRANIHDNITVCDVALGQYADIKRVTVTNNVGATCLLHTVLCYALATEALRNKAVECRNDIRVLLRTVNLEVTANLVQLILYGVGRHHLDKGSNHFGSLLTHLNAVPRVRLVAQTH